MENPGNTNVSVLGPMVDAVVADHNPNYTETVTGTLANPWKNYNVNTLWQQRENNNITLIIEIDASAIVGNKFKISLGWDGSRLLASGASYTSAVSYFDFEAVWSNTTGTLISAYGNINGTVTDYSALADQIPAILTVIYHPLPTT